MLTDVGLLEKIAPDGTHRHFDYFYRATSALVVAAGSLEQAHTAVGWIENHLGAVMAASFAIPISDAAVAAELLSAVELSIGPTGLHIDSFAALAAALALAKGKRLSLGVARRWLVDLATTRPELARLSGGYAGTRAEFASVSLHALARASEDLLAP